MYILLYSIYLLRGKLKTSIKKPNIPNRYKNIILTVLFQWIPILIFKKTESPDVFPTLHVSKGH